MNLSPFEELFAFYPQREFVFGFVSDINVDFHSKINQLIYVLRTIYFLYVKNLMFEYYLHEFQAS
jgi:hypothetical protein